jgi:hypothetical protein
MALREREWALGLMRTIARGAADRRGRLFVIAALATTLAMALGACSKCDVPTWRHETLPNPQSCHDGPAQ